MQNYLPACKIVSTHGVRGEMKALPLCDGAAFLAKFKRLFTSADGAGETRVLGVRAQGNVILLRLDGAPSDETLRREAEQRGIRLAMLSDYYQCPQDAPQHVLVVNYTGIDLDRLPAALERLAALWKENDHV